MNKLGDFVECLCKELPADLQKILIDKFLQAYRSTFMKFYHITTQPVSNPFPPFGLGGGCPVFFGDSTLVLSRYVWKPDISLEPVSSILSLKVFEVKDNELVCTKTADVPLGCAIGEGFLNSQVTKLVFSKYKEGLNSAKYVVDLQGPADYVLMDQGASFMASWVFGLRVFLLENKDEIKLIDPNYPQTLTFLGSSLVAYNGKHALTTKLGGGAYLWRVDPDGTAILLKELLLKDLPSVEDRIKPQVAQFLLGQVGRYFVHTSILESSKLTVLKIVYCDLGKEAIFWEDLSAVLGLKKTLPAVTPQFRGYPLSVFTKTGLLVICERGSDGKMCLYDIHAKKGIALSLPFPLHGRCDKLIISPDESQVYGFWEEQSKMRTFKIDLLHDLKDYSLS